MLKILNYSARSPRTYTKHARSEMIHVLHLLADTPAA